MSRTFAAVLAAAFAAVPAALPAQTISYKDLSTAEKLQSKVDVDIGGVGLGLKADMTLIGQQGTTKVLPRVTSSWTTLEFLDVKTVFVYPDLNAVGASAEPTVDTNVLVRSELPFLERVEATLKRAESASRNSLHLRFAEIGSDVDLFGGRPLNVRTDVTLRSAPDRTTKSSSVTSTWGLGPALDVESVLRLDDSASGAFEPTRIDTKLVYASPVSFIDRLEGKIRREQGTRAQSLAILFPELSTGAEHGTSFSITARALIEELLARDGEETRNVGFETTVAGVLPPLLGGRNALSFKVERSLADGELRRSSLAYDHAWSPGDDASIGLNFKMLRDAEELEPSMGVTWSTRF